MSLSLLTYSCANDTVPHVLFGEVHEDGFVLWEDHALIHIFVGTNNPVITMHHV